MSQADQAAAGQEDTLAGLEDRIQRAVELVQQLRREKADLEKQLAATIRSLSEAQQAGESSTAQKAEITRLMLENEAMRKERDNVRRRVERLLETIDNMGTA
ncbi:MAG: hypothetical protein IPJ98_30140 [Bryobacterales bacterium]|nr:hypothetical protein [Bryobacterales bacterium]